jgi:acyl carrier protein
MRNDVDTILLGFIQREFRGAKGIGPDVPLLKGIVDSLGVFSIVGFIESEFHVTLTDSELTAEHFNTVRALTHLVTAKLDRVAS